MTDVAMIDIVGYWLGIFLTFCVLSFLYKDNPFYKLAEHLFIGISIGYVVIQQYYNVLRPKLVDPIAGSDHWFFNWHLIPLALVLMMFTKVASKRFSWLGRYPLAFVVALYAGIQINAMAQADLAQQIKRAMVDIDIQKVNVNTAEQDTLTTLPGISPSVARKIIAARKAKPFASLDRVEQLATLGPAERVNVSDARGSIQGLDAQASVKDGQRYWFGIFSRILMLLGLIASLVYFYFSIEHKGAIGKVSRVGIWVLMIGFGASFGYTVQGRISLAIGRVQNVRGDTLAPHLAEKVHGPLVALISVLIIVAGIAVLELRGRSKSDKDPDPA